MKLLFDLRQFILQVSPQGLDGRQLVSDRHGVQPLQLQQLVAMGTCGCLERGVVLNTLLQFLQKCKNEQDINKSFCLRW